jgi:hypoxanthine phosphoribosyltransferase
MRREIITWNQVDQLIDHLLPQLDKEFDALLMITCGGIVPGGMLAEALHLNQILTASVDFPAELHTPEGAERRKLAAWPYYLQFPDEKLVSGNKILIVDDVWGSGRTINAVRSRLTSMAAIAFTCVLHFNPHRNLFSPARPDYYAAITDAYIVYPWEITRGPEGISLHNP